jgi:hemoglobin/transferrin/lactoferrin receptor protein
MIVRQSRSVLLVCTAVALVFSVSQSFAQSVTATTPASTTEEGTTLQKIVIKGERMAPGSVADTPLATETTQDVILKKDINNLQDFGRTVEPGVDYVKSTGGMFIRGLGGPRVTTLVDGIPIPYLSNFARAGGPTATTNADGGSDSFDFSSLSAVDVLRGADSSRAGSGALGGAVVLRTLEPEDLIGEGRDWGGLAKLTYDGQDTSIGGSVAIAKKIQNTSIMFQGAYKKGHERESNGDVGGLGATRTEANPGEFDQSNLLFKLRQQLEGGHTIGLTAERYDRDFTNDLKTLQGATSGSSRVYKPGDYDGNEENKRERVSLDYKFEAESADSLIDDANATIYWQKLQRNAGSDGTRVGSVGGPWLRDNEIEEEDIGLTGSMTSRFDTGVLDHQVTLGGDLSFLQASSYLAGLDACILGTATPAGLAGSCPSLHANQADMPDVDGKRLGIYLDDKIAFGDSGFALTPGIRFDWYDYAPKDSAEFRNNPGYAVRGLPDGSDGSHFSPKLLATYDIAPDVQLFAQWSMGFRAPTVNELYLNYANPAVGYATEGNPDLKPETAIGFEIGASLGDDDFGGRVSAFHNRYRNFIDTVSENTVLYPFGLTEYFNRDKVEISGFEANVHRAFANGVNVHAALAYAYGTDTETHEYIRTISPLKTVIGVGYQRETWGSDLSLITAAGMKSDGDAATFDAPGYGTVDLTAWWEPEQTGLRIQGGIYNLFDKTYYNAVALKDVNPVTVPASSNSSQPMDYYSEPGRAFKISLIQRF